VSDLQETIARIKNPKYISPHYIVAASLLAIFGFFLALLFPYVGTAIMIVSLVAAVMMGVYNDHHSQTLRSEGITKASVLDRWDVDEEIDKAYLRHINELRKKIEKCQRLRGEYEEEGGHLEAIAVLDVEIKHCIELRDIYMQTLKDRQLKIRDDKFRELVGHG
jgi:hypothetical protein